MLNAAKDTALCIIMAIDKYGAIDANFTPFGQFVLPLNAYGSSFLRSMHVYKNYIVVNTENGNCSNGQCIALGSTMLRFKYANNVVASNKAYEKTAISIYPNPTKNCLYFYGAINKLQAFVYSASGTLLFTAKFFNNKLDISRLHNGNYYLVLVGKENLKYKFGFSKID